MRKAEAGERGTRTRSENQGIGQNSALIPRQNEVRTWVLYTREDV